MKSTLFKNPQFGLFKRNFPKNMYITFSVVCQKSIPQVTLSSPQFKKGIFYYPDSHRPQTFYPGLKIYVPATQNNTCLFGLSECLLQLISRKKQIFEAINVHTIILYWISLFNKKWLFNKKCIGFPLPYIVLRDIITTSIYFKFYI